MGAQTEKLGTDPGHAAPAAAGAALHGGADHRQSVRYRGPHVHRQIRRGPRTGRDECRHADFDGHLRRFDPDRPRQRGALLDRARPEELRRSAEAFRHVDADLPHRLGRHHDRGAAVPRPAAESGRHSAGGASLRPQLSVGVPVRDDLRHARIPEQPDPRRRLFGARDVHAGHRRGHERRTRLAFRREVRMGDVRRGMGRPSRHRPRRRSGS